MGNACTRLAYHLWSSSRTSSCTGRVWATETPFETFGTGSECAAFWLELGRSDSAGDEFVDDCTGHSITHVSSPDRHLLADDIVRDVASAGNELVGADERFNDGCIALGKSRALHTTRVVTSTRDEYYGSGSSSRACSSTPRGTRFSTILHGTTFSCSRMWLWSMRFSSFRSSCTRILALWMAPISWLWLSWPFSMSTVDDGTINGCATSNAVRT